MAKLFNLARMSTSTTGTGTITLGSAVSGFLTFALAGVSNGDIVSYGISDGADSEVGYGTYTSSGTTLTRNVTRSTNSNNAIDLSGSAEVYITARAEDLVSVTPPQGRLTLATGSPVLTATTTGNNVIYYTPYVGNTIPLYDGSSFTQTTFSEINQVVTDATKSPAATAASNNYDMFVWNDSGTLRCTRGPAWSSATSRGTGAGSSELTRVNGIWLNANAVTNGPAAQRGTYVGTIRTRSSDGNVDFSLGGGAAGGTAGLLGVWNAYNRVLVTASVRDTSTTWTYGTASWRAANNSSTARVSFVVGLNEDSIDATYYSFASQSGTINAMVGIGLDSTTAFSGVTGGVLSNVTGAVGASACYRGLSGIGFHYVSAIEYSSGATATYYGTAGVAYFQTGLFASLLM